MGWKESKRLKTDSCVSSKKQLGRCGIKEWGLWMEFPKGDVVAGYCLSRGLILRVSTSRAGSWGQREPSQSFKENRGQIGNGLISENRSEAMAKKGAQKENNRMVRKCRHRVLPQAGSLLNTSVGWGTRCKALKLSLSLKAANQAGNVGPDVRAHLDGLPPSTAAPGDWVLTQLK